MKNYQLVYHDSEGALQRGAFTTLADARAQAKSLRSAGYVAWVENREHEEIKDGAK